MKNLNYPKGRFSKVFIGVIILIMSLPIGLYAGDSEISLKSFRSIFYINDERTVDIEFVNDEAFDVSGLSLDAKIYYKSGASSWDLVWEWSMEDLTVSANSSLELSSDPSYFSPTLPGLYQLYITSFSAVDIDPSNNNISKDFLVGGYQKISIKQFNMINPIKQERSTLGAIGFKLPPNDAVRFLNVVAQKPETTNNFWLVQNLPVLPFLDTRTLYYHFGYDKLGYADGDVIENLDIAVKETDHEISAKFDVFGFLNKSVRYVDYDIQANNEDENDSVVHSILAELEDLPIPLFGDVYSIDYEYIGCEMPNIILDSNTHGVSADYAGDWNACAPTAAANSMQWLENTIEGFPQTGTSHRQKLEELSKLMNRQNGEGVSDVDFIKGKLAFIDKYKLPIRVSYQSWEDQSDSIASPDTTYGHSALNMSDTASVKQPPTWEFLKEQMKKGADVEIAFGYYDRSGRSHGSHMVAVSGMSETNYARGIYIKDDEDQADSSSWTVRENYHKWVTHDEGIWSRLTGFDGPNNNCFVEAIISEVYDPTVTFNKPGEEPSANSVEPIPTNLSAINLLNNSAPVGEDAILQFNMNEAAMLKIEIYSMHGSLVSNYMFSEVMAGEQTKVLPGRLISKPGNYYIVIKLDQESHMIKMIRY